MDKYNRYLKILETNWHGGTTYNTELTIICNLLLPSKYIGTYAYDKIPKNIKEKHCCIFNLDKSNEPGSHWCGMYKENNIKYVYDSFGRIVIKGKGIIHTDKDKEQKTKEENCGQRCIAWLLCVYNYGINAALKV